jgi:1,4-alpha-glucan branching enzyme
MPSLGQVVLSRVDFTCRAPEATSVFLVGRFDQSKLSLHSMRRSDDDDWSASLALPPGRYPYKFVVVYRGVLTTPEDRLAVVPASTQWN